jgi:hypothetical protein
MPLGRKTTSTDAGSAKPETWSMFFQLKHWRKVPHDNTSNKGHGIKDVTIAEPSHETKSPPPPHNLLIFGKICYRTSKVNPLYQRTCKMKRFAGEHSGS